jgi:alpha-N-arabinofuranosidase
MTQALLTVGAEAIGVISPRLYGAFAEHLGRCCYGGLWVGTDCPDVPHVDGFRQDVVEALRDLPTPMIRWPGGCYADHYHWRSGIGQPAARAGTLGMSCGLLSSDTHALGSHEFMRFCELVGAEPYLAGNVGTGSVQEMCDWIEYMNGSVDSALTRERAANGHPAPWGVRLWGVGNESWDCGGRFDAVSYAHEYRRYAAMIRHVDRSVELVAVGLEDETLPESRLDNEWNARFLAALGPALDLVDHLSIHRYWLRGGPELDFDADQYYALLDEADATEGLIERTARVIADATGGSRRIGVALDEWGVWHPEARDWGPGKVERRKPTTLEQANTLRDGLAAAAALEGFHRQCNVLSMANLAQVVNVLQAVILTDGPSIARTPTYYAIAMHKPHVGAEALPAEVATRLRTPSGRPAVTATASRKSGSVAVTMVNRHLESAVEVEVHFPETAGMLTLNHATVLTADRPNAVNLPGKAEQVSPAPLAGGRLSGRTYTVVLPPHSMTTVQAGDFVTGS